LLFSTSSILKIIKSIKIILKKIIKKIIWGNTVAIHSVLKKKTMKLNSQLTQYEKNKIDKDNSEKKKNHKKEKKTMWRNTVAIHIVLKKKNYETEFSTSSILKKITKTILKKKHKKIKKKERGRRRQFWKKKTKKNKKKHVGKVKAEFSINSILKK
jgi:hypothetical protein